MSVWGRRGWRAASVALILLYVVLATATSIITPAFEAPDEVAHFGYVRALVVDRQLPRLNVGSSAANEAGQTPLYYLAGALATFWLPGWHEGASLLPTWEDSNPDVSFDVDFRQTPEHEYRNLYAHGPDEEFPYRGDVLVLHLLRLVSVGFGTLAVVAVLLIGRTVFPNRPSIALLAGALFALNPQFVFVTAVVNNDSAATAVATLTLFVLLRAIRRGFPRGEAVLLGVACGLAALAKLSLLGLAPVVLLGIALAPSLGKGDAARSVREVVVRGAVVGGVALGVAGWWYTRNWLLYGDPLAWEAMLAAQGQMTRSTPLPFAEALLTLFDARDTYWAVFGWTNVVVEPGWYVAADALVLVAIAGLIVAAGRRLKEGRTSGGLIAGLRSSRGVALPLLLLVLWIAVAGVLLVRWIQVNTAAAQGRLLFPAAGAIAIFLAIGLSTLVPRRFASVVAVVAIVLLASGTGAAVFGTLAPTYHPPAAVAETELQRQGFEPLHLVCDCGIEIVGYAYHELPEAPDDEVVVDFYWRRIVAEGPAARRNWRLNLGLFDPAGAERAKRLGWPAGGRLPTSAAPVGAVFRERVEFPLPATDSAPGAGQIRVTFFDVDGDRVQTGRFQTPEGEDLGQHVALGRFRWPGPPADQSGSPVGAVFGNRLELVGSIVPDEVPAGTSVPVRLYWRAEAPPRADYRVSVQLLDVAGRLVAQADGEPRDGRYPTSLWPVGELVVDERRLSLEPTAPSPLRAVVIVYTPETGERLDVAAAPHLAVHDRAVEVGLVRIGS